MGLEGLDVEEITTTASLIMIGQAAFHAAVEQYPCTRLTLRQGAGDPEAICPRGHSRDCAAARGPGDVNPTEGNAASGAVASFPSRSFPRPPPRRRLGLP
jgi:hypothetical protein